MTLDKILNWVIGGVAVTIIVIVWSASILCVCEIASLRDRVTKIENVVVEAAAADKRAARAARRANAPVYPIPLDAFLPNDTGTE